MQPLWQDLLKKVQLVLTCFGLPWSQPSLKNTARQIPGQVEVFANAYPAQNLAAQWPCVCLQRLWQEVQDQQQHQQTQEAFLVASFTAGKAFATSPCGARGKERKRTVLSSSRKRADILYHLDWKSIIWFLITNKNI